MKTVLITGCGTGIGHAASEFFAERGWNVIAASRDPGQIQFTHASIRPLALDVNHIPSIDRAFASLPPLDCVINNAGYGLLLPFEDTPPEEIERMFRANVFGLMAVCRRAATMMRERGHGHIINVSSALGLIGSPWYAAYSASKWAVEGFSESLAHELKPFNVHVKIVEPSGTKTDFFRRAYVTDVTITDAYRARFEKKRLSRSRHDTYDPPEVIAQLMHEAATDDSWRLRHCAAEVKKIQLWQRMLGRDGLWKRVNGKMGK